MSAMEALRQHGPCDAYWLARVTGKPLERVYVELVAAEARYEARVVVTQPHGQTPQRAWEAM